MNSISIVIWKCEYTKRASLIILGILSTVGYLIPSYVLRTNGISIVTWSGYWDW